MLRLSTCKTPCHLPVAPRRGSSYIEAASIAFCMRCGLNVWLTAPRRRTRSCVLHGLCWCSSPPVWFLHPPHPPPPHPLLAIPMLSYTLAKITAFSNSCADLPPGFPWFWLFYVSLLLTRSVLTYLPVFIWSFSSTASLFSRCEGLSSCLCVCVYLLPSLSLAVSPSF